MGEQKIYLGLDFSTQQIKAIAVNDNLEVIHDCHVKFDRDLPDFGTKDGVRIHDDKVTVTSPTAMWVKALDLLLDRMKSSGFDFSKVVAVSGAGQQCGSVYWKQGARNVLNSLQPGMTMYEQLKDSFSVPDSPIWMDASTTKQCRQLEQAVGGPQELATLTGSRGYERFTGNQIMKVYQTNQDGYNNTEELATLTGSRGYERYTGNQIMKVYQTNQDGYNNIERISLVSSFAASLFLGDYAAIDLSDGSGMNLLDITSKTWSPKCLDACAPGLADKLGDPVPSHTILGNVSTYLVQKYGFPAEAKVVTYTGDNCSSLAGLAPREGDVIVSLGSSDTVFLWIPEATPGLNGHVFVNPLDPNTYMGLVCFKNGSLTRERIMEKHAGGSWDTFSKTLKQTQPGNGGNIGVYFDTTEIQPVVMGTFRFGPDDSKVTSFPAEVEVRAVLESQFMARLMYAQYCGLKIGPQSRVLATGGASANADILQVIADIFNKTVYTTDVPNSASLGGCYRAKHAMMPSGTKFCDVVKNLPQPACAAKHTAGVEKVYEVLLERYRKLEAQIAAELEAKESRIM